MRAVFLKEFQELRRDRRTLGMLIVMPLLLLVIFGYAANFTVDTFTLSIYGSAAEDVQSQIEDNDDLADHFDILTVDTDGTKTDAETELREDKADVAILADGDSVTVYIDGSNLFAAQGAQVLFAQVQQQLAQNPQAPAMEVEILFNPDLKTSWVMIPAIIGLILTFIGTIITSIGLVREREAGTMEQLAVMPLKAPAVILGKIMPYFLLASFDMVLIAGIGIWLFGVPFNGNPWIFVVGAALFLFAVLGIGVLISSVSQTSGQAIQLAMMTLLPQILLSGMIFPLDAMAPGVRWIGYLLPLTYFTMLSQGVMLRDAPWDSLWLPLTVLAIMAVVIFGLAVIRLHRSIAPAKQRSAEDAK
ncbi:ABC transporter permease [Microbacterium thalassium]|uniref:ABC-2 type transport system permease protein n=1 Tax=Microbacterium thalassium TaxID=362649 RepID=A0A7X0FLM9_9MICO|nr:ABC transporter permease [Microbacterium thalassium]MBB6389769.1 ABC-2 type transport system permease protein [Microbacterium thalassium]GLK24457.1 transport permease protein [Microbacterium thalassium]